MDFLLDALRAEVAARGVQVTIVAVDVPEEFVPEALSEAVGEVLVTNHWLSEGVYAAPLPPEIVELSAPVKECAREDGSAQVDSSRR